MASWNDILVEEYRRNKKKYAPKKGQNWTPIAKAKNISRERDEKQMQKNQGQVLTSRINQGLDRGYSWEKIAEENDIDKERIAEYSRGTRPNYGVSTGLSAQVTGFGRGLIEGVTDLPREGFQRIKDNFGDTFNFSEDDNKEREEFAQNIQNANKKRQERNWPKDIEQVLSGEGSRGLLLQDNKELVKMVANDAPDEEIRNFIGEAKQRKTEFDKKFLGAATEAASYGLFVPGLSGVLRGGGKAAIGKALATETAGGGLGNVGYSLRNDPNASVGDLAKDFAIGGAASAGLGVVGAGVGAGYRKLTGRNALDGAEKVLTKADEAAAGSKGFVPETKALQKIDDKPFVPPNNTYDANTYAHYTAKKRAALEKEASKNTLSLSERANNNFFDRLFATRKRAKQALEGAGIDSQDYLDRLEIATGNVSRSSIMADAYMKDGGFFNVIEKTGNKAGQERFEEYLLAKGRQFRRAEATSSGKKLSKGFMEGAAQDARTVSELADAYEPLAQELHGFSQQFLRDMANPESMVVDGGRAIGLIDPEVAEELIKRNPEYIPLNKVLEEVEQTGSFSAKNIGSISESGLNKRFKGASGLEKSPLETIYEKAHKSFQEIGKNETATLIKQLKDIDGNPLGIKVLRNADEVRKRTNIRSILKNSKPIAKKLQRLRKKYAKELRVLAKEVEGLEDIGQKKLLDKSDEARKVLLKNANDGARMPGTSKKTSTIVDIAEDGTPSITKETKDVGRSKRAAKLPTTEEAEEILSRWIESDESGLKGITNRLKKGRTRYSGLAKELESIEMAAKQVAQERKNLYYEGIKAGDKTAKGKTTISRLDNGVKEIIEVPDYMEQALKGMNPKQTHAVIRGLFMFNRIRKLGFTGASPGFSVRNAPRDIQFKGVAGRSGIQAYRPDDILRGYVDAVLDTSLKKEALKNGAFGNLVDTLRPTKQAVEGVRAGRNKGAKVGYTITHPKELFRVFEDAVSVTETASRAQAYNRRYKQVMKKTKNPGRATREATLAGRRDSIDFFTQGEYGDLIKGWGLYLNPAIQGTRRLGQAIKEQPFRVTGRMAATVVGPSIATAVWNMSDDKRREAYESLPRWEKDSNHVIVGPNPTYNEEKGRWDGVYKIPKVPGIREIGNAAEELVRKGMTEGVDFQDFLREIGYGTAKVVTPEETVTNAATPDPLEPGFQQLFNQNFFTGKEIVPTDKETREFREDLASPTAKGITNILKKAGIDWSPLRTDALLKDITGSAGQGVQNLLESNLTDEKPGGKGYIDQIKDSFLGAYGDSGYKETANKEARKEIAKRVDNAKEENRNRYYARHAVERDKEGNLITDDSLFYKEQNAAELLESLSDDGELYELEKFSAEKLHEATGKPIHPIYKESKDKVAAFLLAQLEDGGIPGSGGDVSTDILYTTPWYGLWELNMSDYYADKTEWEIKMGYKDPAKIEPMDLRPLQSPNIENKLKELNELPQGDGARGGNKSRAIYLQNNPDLVTYFNASREARNKQRLEIALRLGLPLPYERSYFDDEDRGITGPPIPTTPFGNYGR